MCYKILKPNGKVILHLGKTDKVDMAEELSRRARTYFNEVYRGSENVQEIEKKMEDYKAGRLKLAEHDLIEE